MVYNVSAGQMVAWGAVAVWDLIWRGQALWHSGRRGQKVWFVALLVVNSAGVLPIVYLLLERSSNKKDSS